MQFVQTRKRRLAPFTTARTCCKFTFQRRLVTLWAWLIRLPNWGPRPQISHTLAMKKFYHALVFLNEREAYAALGTLCEKGSIA